MPGRRDTPGHRDWPPTEVGALPRLSFGPMAEWAIRRMTKASGH